jgi:hypothetical protein
VIFKADAVLIKAARPPQTATARQSHPQREASKNPARIMNKRRIPKSKLGKGFIGFSGSQGMFKLLSKYIFKNCPFLTMP